MLVLKTTSPEWTAVAPKARPRKIVPSASARAAGRTARPSSASGVGRIEGCSFEGLAFEPGVALIGSSLRVHSALKGVDESAVDEGGQHAAGHRPIGPG